MIPPNQCFGPGDPTRTHVPLWLKHQMEPTLFDRLAYFSFQLCPEQCFGLQALHVGTCHPLTHPLGTSKCKPGTPEQFFCILSVAGIDANTGTDAKNKTLSVQNYR